MWRVGLSPRSALFLLVAAAVSPASLAPAQQPAPLTRPATPLPPGTSVAPAPAPLFPNGASSVVETFGDWTVDCRAAEGRKLCLLAQSQGDTRSGQRVFAIELRAPREGRSDGTILMPFGLKLENGAILKLDDKDLGQGVRFSTCVPAGCLLPVSFPKVATDAMTSATKLTVAALSLSSGEAVTFNVTLNGFSAALARAAQLGD
ncbi:invasion associated locus B family protein [Phreatobacter cathodiphilus]|uniref:Invasion protein n=1 Tax=Phreatobacter cathodiphilus TaxID=1868589 RepID=A0A2S0NGQ6_9HYPH|nr:invasion associated locus B family protein [Phreatobacter cathodiphilus]AVO47226.1 invasion protein [Phreatobacter cathodiphilus]